MGNPVVRDRYLDWQRTGVVVAATIAGILAVDWLIRRRTAPASWRSAIFAGRRWVIGAVSLLLSAGIVAARSVIYGAILSSVDAAGDGVSDFVSGQVGHGLPVFGGVLIVAALLPFTLARLSACARCGTRPRTSCPRIRNGTRFSCRGPSLTTGGCSGRAGPDRTSILERLCLRRFERFEEVAAATLAAHDPVLALSQPKEKLPPPLGAERRSFSMDDWQDRIRDLISAARLICVTVGRSTVPLWEIGEHPRRRGAGPGDLPASTHQTISNSAGGSIVLAHALRASTSPCWMRPARISDVLAVVFLGGDVASGAVPVVITGPAPDDVGYEAAIGRGHCR